MQIVKRCHRVFAKPLQTLANIRALQVRVPRAVWANCAYSAQDVGLDLSTVPLRSLSFSAQTLSRSVPESQRADFVRAVVERTAALQQQYESEMSSSSDSNSESSSESMSDEDENHA